MNDQDIFSQVRSLLNDDSSFIQAQNKNLVKEYRTELVVKLIELSFKASQEYNEQVLNCYILDYIKNWDDDSVDFKSAIFEWSPKVALKLHCIRPWLPEIKILYIDFADLPDRNCFPPKMNSNFANGDYAWYDIEKILDENPDVDAFYLSWNPPGKWFNWINNKIYLADILNHPSLRNMCHFYFYSHRADDFFVNVIFDETLPLESLYSIEIDGANVGPEFIEGVGNSENICNVRYLDVSEAQHGFDMLIPLEDPSLCPNFSKLRRFDWKAEDSTPEEFDALELNHLLHPKLKEYILKQKPEFDVE